MKRKIFQIISGGSLVLLLGCSSVTTSNVTRLDKLATEYEVAMDNYLKNENKNLKLMDLNKDILVHAFSKNSKKTKKNREDEIKERKNNIEYIEKLTSSLEESTNLLETYFNSINSVMTNNIMVTTIQNILPSQEKFLISQEKFLTSQKGEEEKTNMTEINDISNIIEITSENIRAAQVRNIMKDDFIPVFKLLCYNKFFIDLLEIEYNNLENKYYLSHVQQIFIDNNQQKHQEFGQNFDKWIKLKLNSREYENIIEKNNNLMNLWCQVNGYNLDDIKKVVN